MTNPTHIQTFAHYDLCGITTSRQQMALWYIREKPGASLAEIARILGVKYATAQNVAFTLEKKGLFRIERHPSAPLAIGRSRPYLTDKGTELLDKIDAIEKQALSPEIVPSLLENLRTLPPEILIDAINSHPAHKDRTPHADRDKVVTLTCSLWKVAPEDLLSDCRTASIAMARIAAMATLYEYGQSYHISSPTCAALFGKKDHATILHARKRIYDFYETEPAFSERLRSLRRILGLPADLPRRSLEPSTQTSFAQLPADVRSVS